MNKEINNKTTPEKRFPNFRNSVKWNVEPMDEVYSFITTNIFSRENLNYTSGVVKNIHYGDIHSKFSVLFDISKELVPFINPTISLEKIDNWNYCRESDMIFADASEDLNDVGKSIEIVNLNNEKLLSGMHTLLARQKEAKIVIGFGGYLFMSSSIRNQIRKEAQGTKVFGISATRIAKINIYYPESKDEQQKIADCLSSLDNLISAETQKLYALKDHKKGLMQQLFPGEGEMVPKLRFEEFRGSGDWVEKTLGDIGEFVGGGTPDTSIPEYWDGEIQWFTPSEVKERFLFKSKRTITAKGLQNSSAKMNPIGTLLITTRATIGDVGIACISCATNQGFQSLVVNSNEVNIFWYYWIILNKVELVQKSSGSTFPEIGKNEIKKIKTICPKKDEQQKVADCLTSLDEYLTSQMEKIKFLQNHKKGLLQGLFPNLNDVNV